MDVQRRAFSSSYRCNILKLKGSTGGGGPETFPPLESNTSSPPLLLELHVQAETADLVGQDVEAGGSAGLEGVFALDHALIDLGAALDIVGLYGPCLQRKSEF